jgi:hypothetical protein
MLQELDQMANMSSMILTGSAGGFPRHGRKERAAAYTTCPPATGENPNLLALKSCLFFNTFTFQIACSSFIKTEQGGYKNSEQPPWIARN